MCKYRLCHKICTKMNILHLKYGSYLLSTCVIEYHLIFFEKVSNTLYNKRAMPSLI
jgi:hypothetical protein